jgi:alpha-D-ribose 1-methylphosphonate 5-phosphate C-P lyase
LQEIFKKAIKRYLEKQEKKELLLHLLQWMAGQGYCVDATTRNLLLKNTNYFGSKQVIAEILAKQQVAHMKLDVKSKTQQNKK